MANLLDGPAKGAKLTLSRSPVFLRVVRKPGGEWDALDLLEDTPAPEEEIHVYRLCSEPVIAHVDGRDPKTGKRYGKWISFADYALGDVQPDDRVARDQAAWQDWCQTQWTRRPVPTEKCPHCTQGYVQDAGFAECNHCNPPPELVP